jgi:carboxyl-terminal processing protease
MKEPAPMNVTTPRRAILLAFSLFVGGVLFGAWTGKVSVARAQDPYLGLEVFARVLTTIESDYVTPVDSDTLLVAAIKGMLEELDPHTRWLSPEQVRNLRKETEGGYSGIGVELQVIPTGAEVTKVFPDSPAQRDGIFTGDLILSIDGQPLAGSSGQELESKFLGPRGSETLLQIKREGEPAPLNINTVRDVIRIPAIESQLFDDRIAYYRIVQFQEGTARELERAHIKLASKNSIDGVIIDLRDNLGGLLDEAIAVTDLFLDDGLMVSTRSRSEGEVLYNATAGGFPANLKVVALTNHMSASAAEIVAGALQDTGRGLLVGSPTFGKGSVQSLYTHPDDSALKLTIGEYFTPSGEPVAPREGRIPDILVPSQQVTGPRDQLQSAIRTLDLPIETISELLALVEQIPADSSPRPLNWDADFEVRRQEVQLARAIAVFDQ